MNLNVDYADLLVLYQALDLAADARLIEVCQTLGMTTIAAGNFQDRCRELRDDALRAMT